MKGPSFIGLHELFDQVAEAVEGYVDQIAERVVQLGGVAEGTVRMAAARTTSTPQGGVNTPWPKRRFGTMLMQGGTPAHTMKRIKPIQDSQPEAAKAARSGATAAERSAAGKTGKTTYSSVNPSRMSWREIQRWLHAEGDVIAKHPHVRNHSLHD